MSGDEGDSMAGLKQLLVTGSNSEYGDHLARHMVDWFQFNERQRHKRELQGQSPLPNEIPVGDGSVIRAACPVDGLLANTSIIPKLVEEGQADHIIDTLRAYSQLPYVDKEVLVLCLAVASKQSEQKKLVTDAHSAVRELCTDTHLFFLFIQFSKMIAKKGGHSGWGRGLRRAVVSWYMGWEPRRLALEVTRHASAHGWTHKDIIRLAHLKLTDMPIGTQVVVHYVFKGLATTTEKYGGKDHDQLLDLLAALDKDGHPQAGEKTWDVDQVIGKLDKVHEAYGDLTLQDVPSQVLKSQELWSHLLDKLEGDSVLGSVNRMGRCNLLNPDCEAAKPLQDQLINRLNHDNSAATVDPTQVLLTIHAYQHPSNYIVEAISKVGERGGRGGVARGGSVGSRVISKRYSKVNLKVVDAMHDLLATSAKRQEKTSRKMCICIDVRTSMGTSTVWTGNPEGKGEVRCHAAAAVMALTLSSGGTNTSVSTLAFSKDSLTPVDIPESAITYKLVDTFKKIAHGEVKASAALEWGQKNSADTVVMITHKLDQQDVTDVAEALTQYNKDKDTHLRLVLCGLNTKRLNITQTLDLLLVLGFHQRTPTIIRAFHERYF